MLGCHFGCGKELAFATSTKTTGLSGKKYWTTNLAVVWGQMAVGGGFNSLEGTMCILGIPAPSSTLNVQLASSSGPC